MIKTVILSGTEQMVQLDGNSTYFWVQNLSEADVLVSLSSGIVDGADNVLTIPAGGAGYVRDDTTATELYILGTGKVQIYGTNNAFCPFKSAPAANGGGGGETTNLPTIKSGKVTITQSRENTVYFDQPFSEIPVIALTVERPANYSGTAAFPAVINSIATDRFTVQATVIGSAGGFGNLTATVDWIAIGK